VKEKLIPSVRLYSPFLLLAVGLVGYWGPWVDALSPALQLTGQDLGEFVKFLPGVRLGTLRVYRQLFYLPPWAAALIIALLVGTRPPFAPDGSMTRRADRSQTGQEPQSLTLPAWLRWTLAAVAVPVVFAILPPVYGSLHDLWVPEFRLQFIALVIALLALAGHPLLRWLPHRVQWGLMALLAFAAALLPLWQFLAVRPAISAVYGHPVPIGWGVWVTTAGFLLLGGSVVGGTRYPDAGSEDGGEDG